MDFISKIVLVENGDGFFGPGVRDLLLNIESEKSVRRASEKMQISYSKAWKIIRNVEKAMGESAVIRIHGGSDGGSASLSEAGKALLQKYMDFEEKSRIADQKIFEEIFK